MKAMSGPESESATADRAIASMFDRHVALRAVVDAVLEGRLGVWERDGDAAVLRLGCYEIFGGDPDSEGARRLARKAARPIELVFGNDPAWRKTLAGVHPDAVDRPMVDFDPSELDPKRLRAFEAVPAELELRPLDLPLARQLDEELVPHGLQVFSTPGRLVAEAPGFGVVAGDRLVAAATAYALSSRFVEVAISTRPEFRGRGLAAACGAAMLRECLTRGLSPRWSASNPVSQRLAERLGYRRGGVCEVLYLA